MLDVTVCTWALDERPASLHRAVLAYCAAVCCCLRHWVVGSNGTGKADKIYAGCTLVTGCQLAKVSCAREDLLVPRAFVCADQDRSSETIQYKLGD
jgi:hypothetical protein